MIITEVAAALIRRGDKFMICQRPAHKARGLLWEFVGGKLEVGETAAQALVRECREELDVEVEVGDVFMEVVHQYPDIAVRLTVFNASIVRDEPRLLEHNAISWITPDEIGSYEFCPADKDILARITEEYAAKKMDKKYALYLSQKEVLDTFLSTGALDKAQYEKSLTGLRTKLGIE